MENPAQFWVKINTLAERPFFEPGVGRVVDIENKERDQLCKETRRFLRKGGAAFGQPELAFGVST